MIRYEIYIGILFLLVSADIFAQQNGIVKYSPDHSLFYLQRSNKQIYFNNKTTAEQIKRIDSMLVSPRILSDKITSLTPGCAVYYTYGIEASDSFSAIEGKPIGIWVLDNPKYYHKAKQYGFTKLLLTQYDNIDSAINAGFEDKNLMLQINNTAQKITKNLGAYYIDEPFENYRKDWNKEKILTLAKALAPAPLYIGSYRWPNSSFFNFFNGNGSEYKDLLTNETSLPVYIMCDEYHGNCSGNTDEFWDKFRDVYGKEKNISNWINDSINSGDGNSNVNCFYNSKNSSDFYTLIKKAEELKLKEIWMFAFGDYWNEENIKKFAGAAFRLNWLSRKGREFKITWKCIYRSEASPCSQCDFEKGKGSWLPVNYEYTGK